MDTFWGLISWYYSLIAFAFYGLFYWIEVHLGN